MRIVITTHVVWILYLTIEVNAIRKSEILLELDA